MSLSKPLSAVREEPRFNRFRIQSNDPMGPSFPERLIKILRGKFDPRSIINNELR